MSSGFSPLGDCRILARASGFDVVGSFDCAGLISEGGKSDRQPKNDEKNRGDAASMVHATNCNTSVDVPFSVQGF
jgi:hypothetical protein